MVSIKLAALCDEKGIWHKKFKLSDDYLRKTFMPGLLQTRRYIHNGQYVGDVVFEMS
jgi:hypothetical protein